MSMNRRSMVDRVGEYVAHRRHLGFELKTSTLVLMEFARFADRLGHRGPLTTNLIMRWATGSREHSARYQAERLSIARGFARFLAARDGKTEVPEQRLLPSRFGRKQPHIYTEDQLRQMVRFAARASSRDPLRARAYATVFGLLASTGLRVSEALALGVTDVDLEGGILRVRRTKFRKSRLIPMHPTTMEAMRCYKARRDDDRFGSASVWFFVGYGNRPLPYSSVRNAFRRLRIQLGWRTNGDLPFPRIHDLRHTFACRRLLAWHRDGVELEQALTSLSTYLGHGKVTDTYWYLTGTGELLSIVGNRFERFARQRGRS